LQTLELYFCALVNTNVLSASAGANVIKGILEAMGGSDVRLSAKGAGYLIAAMEKYFSCSEVKLMLEMMQATVTIEKCLSELKEGSEARHLCGQALRRNGHNSNFTVEVTSATSADSPTLVRDLWNRKPSNRASPIPKSCAASEIGAALAEQLSQEIAGVVPIPNILLRQSVDTDQMQAKQRKLSDLRNSWTPAILKEFRCLKQAEHARMAQKGTGVYPFLCLLPEEAYVDIIITKLMSIDKNGEITAWAATELGGAVYSRYVSQHLLKHGGDHKAYKLYKEYARNYTQLDTCELPRILWMKLESELGEMELEQPVLPWTKYWRFNVGIRLLEVMVASVTMDIGRGNTVPSAFVTDIPAVYISYKAWGQKMYGMTTPHPLFAKLALEGSEDFRFESSILPMVVSPLPWLKSLQGGYLLSPTSLVRVHTETVRNDPHETDIDGCDISSIYDALNVQASTAWRINKRVLDVQLAVFDNDGDESLAIAPPASVVDSVSFQGYDKLEPNEQRLLKKEAYFAKKRKRELHSLHCDAVYKFSIANYYRNRVIWFPHNIDFRGRSYPVPRHFNYMGKFRVDDMILPGLFTLLLMSAFVFGPMCFCALLWWRLFSIDKVT